MVNKVILLGRLGADAEEKHAPAARRPWPHLPASLWALAMALVLTSTAVVGSVLLYTRADLRLQEEQANQIAKLQHDLHRARDRAAVLRLRLEGAPKTGNRPSGKNARGG